MIILRNLLVLSTFVLSAFSSPAKPQHDSQLVDWNRLSRLLDGVDPKVLNSVLQSLAPKYKEGVFHSHRSAIEVVHSENPMVATKLVWIAKRQGNSTVPPATTSSTPAQSSEARSISSLLSSKITASELPGSTTIKVAPSTPIGATPIRTISDAVVFSSSGGGLVTMTSSDVGVHFTKSTSTHLYFTTLPDGSVSTSTQLVIVNAPVTETADATGAAGAASTSPGLQNGAAKVAGAGLSGMIIGAAGFFMAVL